MARDVSREEGDSVYFVYIYLKRRQQPGFLKEYIVWKYHWKKNNLYGVTFYIIIIYKDG